MHHTATPIDTMDDIKALVAEDFAAVDALISEQLTSKVPLIKVICEHIIKSGGKRLRPLLVLMIAKALGYQGDKHIILAAIIEFIHTATLLHDDVIDESDMRRGKETANRIWGNEASVLVGDFLYTRTFHLLTHINNNAVLETLAGITKIIAEGEMLQLQNRNKPHVTEADYMQVIESKTAKLFEAATQLSALLADFPETQAAARYGHHLGMAFQLIDDALDYSGDAKALGKNVGDDLAEGKPTLPLIYAYARVAEDDKRLIEHAILEGGIDKLEPIMAMIESCNALDYTRQKAQEQVLLAQHALESFPESPYKSALFALAEFSVGRSF